MDKQLSVLLYKQMVLPVFDYTSFIFDGALVNAKSCLQTIQNHCLRCCMSIKDPRDISRTDLHSLCNCSLLVTRRNTEILCLMYKFSKQPDNVLVPARVLRNNNKIKLKVPRPNSALYRRSPLYRGNTLWYNLNANQHHLDTKFKFLVSLTQGQDRSCDMIDRFNYCHGECQNLCD